MAMGDSGTENKNKDDKTTLLASLSGLDKLQGCTSLSSCMGALGCIGCLPVLIAVPIAAVAIAWVALSSPTPTLAAPARVPTMEQRCRSIGRVPGRVVDRDGNLISHYCPRGSDEY